MSDKPRKAVLSGILLIIGAGLSWLTWRSFFFFPLMIVIGFILFMVGAQSL